MKTVYKFELENPHVAIELPIGAKVIHFGMQAQYKRGHQEVDRRGFIIWVELDPELDVCERKFSLFLTGEPLAPMPGGKFVHIKTIQVPDVGFETVWHLYEHVDAEPETGPVESETTHFCADPSTCDREDVHGPRKGR